jgi:hypothetical protein
VAHYESYNGESNAVHAVGSLASYIAGGPLANALFAWTSLFALCITQTLVTYPYDGPHLRVEPRPDGQIEFRYIDTWEKDQQWVRVVKLEEVVPTMHSFLRRLKWVSEDLLRE